MQVASPRHKLWSIAHYLLLVSEKAAFVVWVENGPPNLSNTAETTMPDASSTTM